MPGGICVFAGSTPGRRPSYGAAAAALGAAIAATGRDLVYGGGALGLMGIVADAALAAGGRVIGVIPEALVAAEVAHRGLTDLRQVAGMHERKALMAELSDAFVALPGGLGTFEELFEAVTWAQLGLHLKPIGLLDVDGFYQPLLAAVEHAAAEGFIRPAHAGLLVPGSDPIALVGALLAYQPPPPVSKWVER